MPLKPRALRPYRPCVPTAGPKRASAHKRGYTKKSWTPFAESVKGDVAKERFPFGGPLCVTCGAAATCVDHIRPFRGDRDLQYDPLNVQSLCDSCHSRKTATEDGGFGRPVASRCQ